MGRGEVRRPKEDRNNIQDGIDTNEGTEAGNRVVFWRDSKWIILGQRVL